MISIIDAVSEEEFLGFSSDDEDLIPGEDENESGGKVMLRTHRRA